MLVHLCKTCTLAGSKKLVASRLDMLHGVGIQERMSRQCSLLLLTSGFEYCPLMCFFMQMLCMMSLRAPRLRLAASGIIPATGALRLYQRSSMSSHVTAKHLWLCSSKIVWQFQVSVT